MRGKQKRIAIPVKHMRNLLDALDALENIHIWESILGLEEFNCDRDFREVSKKYHSILAKRRKIRRYKSLKKIENMVNKSLKGEANHE